MYGIATKNYDFLLKMVDYYAIWRYNMRSPQYGIPKLTGVFY